MVLDPITAISVASAVIQFVDFGTKLISKGIEYYESADGVLAEHAEQAAVTDRLSDLTKRLSQTISSTSNNRKLSHAEEALQEVTDECRSIAEEFAVTLDKLRITGHKHKWKSLRQAFQSVWQKDEIERHLVRLDRLRQQVVIHLLVVINDGQMKAFRKIDIDIHSLDGKIQNVVRLENENTRQQITELNKHMSELLRQQARDNKIDLADKLEARRQVIDDWRRQNETQLNAILDKISQMDIIEREEEYKQAVLDSLYFQSIDDRHNMIDKKAEMTLGWVYSPPDGTDAKWSSFASWLKGTGGLYWIAGKAGSGKSTLMKFLYHDSRTYDLLKQWSCGRRLLLARYFLWISGKSDAQKSLSGLLRSILYDLLQQCPDVIMSVSNSRWRFYDLKLAHFPAWTNEDLVAAIRIFISKTADRACICLFIDGLDEFDGKDHQRLEVVELLKSLSQSINLKICVSSRPWELFKETFDAYPNLRLELLTEQDIRNYVEGTFAANEKFQALRMKDEEVSSQLVAELIDKAKGVWLWVVLVTRSLSDGVRYKDTAADLLARLHAIPEELEEYFLQMFNRIDSFYKPKALKMFKVLLDSAEQVTLMSLSFLDEASDDFASKMAVKYTSDAAVRERIEVAGSRLNARCLGLLEPGAGQVYGGMLVDFLHRTAHDFVAHPDTQKVIGMSQVDTFDVELFLCQSLLAQIKMMTVSLTRPPSFDTTMTQFMLHAASYGRADSADTVALLSHLDSVLFGRDWGSLRAQPSCIVASWSFEPDDEAPSLPLCIQFGLTKYVQHILRTKPKLASVTRYRPLLDLALRRHVYSDGLEAMARSDMSWNDIGWITPDVEVVRLILEQGADPNEQLGESTVWTTVWREYLQLLDKIADYLNKDMISSTVVQPWIDAAELCIRYGAIRVLESSTNVPSQPSSRTRVRTSRREVLAKTTLAAAFGEKEANRLDSLSWQLDITGMNLVTNLNRRVRSLFG